MQGLQGLVAKGMAPRNPTELQHKTNFSSMEKDWYSVCTGRFTKV